VVIRKDNSCIASGSLDDSVRLWHIETGQLLECFHGHSDSIYSISFSPDGNKIVSGALDQTIKVWSLSDATRHSIKAYNGGHFSFKTIENSNWTHSLVGHGDYVLSVGYPGQLDFPHYTGPPIELVVSGSKDRNVTLWDAYATDPIHPLSVPILTLQGHKNSVISLDCVLSKQMIVTGSGDMNARVWKLNIMDAGQEMTLEQGSVEQENKGDMQ
jgi:glucose repression regulatory protein TUP1